MSVLDPKQDAGDSTELLERGPHSCFVILEDLEWVQPTYMIESRMPEDEFSERVLEHHGKRAMFVYGVQRDDDAPSDCVHPLPGEGAQA